MSLFWFEVNFLMQGQSTWRNIEHFNLQYQRHFCNDWTKRLKLSVIPNNFLLILTSVSYRRIHDYTGFLAYAAKRITYESFVGCCKLETSKKRSCTFLCLSHNNTRVSCRVFCQIVTCSTLFIWYDMLFSYDVR